MGNKYLFKVAFLLVLLLQFFSTARGQYAIGGTAGTTLVNSVYWLTWDKGAAGSTMISSPAGSDHFDIINGTYVWQFSPTVRITAIVSNEVTSNGNPMQAYTPGSYAHDGLNYIYSGNTLPAPNTLGVANSALVTPYGQTVTFDLDIKVSILINNVYTDVNYPGMVIGDAESLDSQGEYISGTSPSPIAWQLLNKRTTGNVADSHYKMDLSNGGTSFKLYTDLAPGNFGVQAVLFAHGARNLKNVSMKGSGLQALAIGFVLPFDLGDAPLSYGTAGHYIDSFQITDYYAGDGTYSVVNYNTTPLIPQATVYIGSGNVDADGQPVGGPYANHDDTTGNNDEASINPLLIPVVKVNQANDVVLTVPVTNTKPVAATLYAWMDFNGDGIFATNEMVSAVVPANTNNGSFTLTFTNASFASKVKVGPLYARLRITTSNLVDDPTTLVDERSTSFAADGEAEDYRLKDIIGVNISGSVVDDNNGGLDNAISGPGLQTVSGSQLYAYLVNNAGTIIDKVTVSTTGTYAFVNQNNGAYKVAVSTNNVAIGGTLASVGANLPGGWVASGASYGINNSAGTGIQLGAASLQAQVNTPGNSLDVTNVNLGINQIPVAVPYSATTPLNTPVSIAVPSNDSDPDGSLDATKVLLTDPADNTEKTSVKIAGQGTYTVNTTTGNVTFTPTVAFVGKATPINYTIKDNFGSESLPALLTVSVMPVGVNDKDVTPINTAVTTTVKANDGASATGTTVTPTNGLHGTTTVDAAGKVTYTPSPGFVGVDTYTYTLTTADGVVSAPITVTVTVKPVGVPDAASTTINNPITTVVTANDGPSGVNAIVIATNGAHGNTSVDPTGKVAYTPAAGYMGKDSYTYTLTNNGVTSDPVTVSVVVKPVGIIDSDTTLVNTPITTNVKANDGASAIGTTVAATNGSHGITSVDAQGKVTYTPVAGYVGTDIYTYTLTTPDGVTSDPVFVTINITNSTSFSLTKKANNTGSRVGDVLNYTLVVTNTGAVKLTNVMVADTGADVGSITPSVIPSLAGGASATVTARHTLKQFDINNGFYTNQASVSGTDPSGRTVTLLKSDDPTTAAIGDPTLVVLTISPITSLAFKIPTLFTPNGDGINDTFEIRGLNQFADNNLTIVNRWGNEVYKQSNYQNNWTGAGLNDGTYYYILQVRKTTAADWIVYTGYVTLIRSFRK